MKSILEDVYTATDAAIKWGVGESTVRNYAAQGKFPIGEAKKSGGTWLVTGNGMRIIFGEKKEAE